VCRYCDVLVTKVNLRRHCARHHCDDHSTPLDSGVCSDGTRVSESSVTLSCSAATVPPSADVVTQAVLSLLEQHDRYTKASLCDYLQEQFPEIDPIFRSVIVTAATSAAQYVAATHNVFYSNRESPDNKKRIQAAEARSVLSFWTLGPRVPPRGIQSAQSSVSLIQSAIDTTTAMTSAAMEDDAHATIENLLVTREVPVPLVPSGTQLMTLMNEAGAVFVPPEMPVSVPELQTSAPDAISVMIASASDAAGVGSSIEHDSDGVDVQLFETSIGVAENLDDPANIEEYETLDPLQICVTPSGSIEEEPIGNFQPALPLLSPLAASPDRHRHSIHPTAERRGDSTSAFARRRDLYDERKRRSPPRHDSVRRREHPTNFRRYPSHHGRQIRLSLEEYRELQDGRRRTSAVRR